MAAETHHTNDDIEVTPEMLRAGIEEFCLFDSEDRGEWIVTAVYRAMAKVKEAAAAPPR